MEYYTYVNIFATKGLEYLLLLAFLALFMFFLRYLSSSAKKNSSSPEKSSTPAGEKDVTAGIVNRKPQ